MEEKKLAKIRKSNMKLYPIYKMVGLDWIFYHGIQILFLTQVKHISPADVILATSSLYAFFSIVFQIPCIIIVEKIGKRNSIVLGQALNLLAMGLTAWCPNFMWLVLSQLISGIGFQVKGISESSFLNGSLPKSHKKSEMFSKIDGGGYAKYCYLAATSVFISGFLYDLNPYIPIALCMFFNLIALILACNFIDIEKYEKQKKVEQKDMKEIVCDLKESFQFIFTSRRLRTLLIMIGFLWGILCLASNYQETMLKEMEIPAYYIGIILATFQVLIGNAAAKSYKFHNKFRNKSFTVMGLGISIGCILAGLVLICPIPFQLKLLVILGVFVIRALAKGAYQVNKKRYMANFTNKKILTKIYSVDTLIKNIARMSIGFIGSMMLKVTSTANASIIIGIVFTMLMILLYFYSKNRIGLKPEEYDKRDIQYAEEVVK